MQIKNIVFPVDFSARSKAAAPFVQSMARRYGAVVTLVHAVPPLPPFYFDASFIYAGPSEMPSMETAIETRLKEFASNDFPHMETHCVVLDGKPARAIVEYAEDQNADLIALPTHGYGLFRRAL